MTAERRTAAAWLAAGEAAFVVEVVGARGSVPRGAGTRMVVGRRAVAGTIGGGHLELKAIAHARRRLPAANALRPADTAAAAASAAATTAGAGSPDAAAVDPAAPDELHFPLGPALGQCCGGAVTLRFSPLDAAALAAWPEPPLRFQLQLHGAGHVGRAIVRALAPLEDIAVDWIDGREDEFPAVFPGGAVSAGCATATGVLGWPAQVRKVCSDAPEDEVADAPPGVFYLVLTHRHDLDLRIVEAVLRRGDFGFLGLIGSQTKKQRFIHHLERRGIAPSAIDRMTCPIGVAGIDGKEPEVIAIAVAAQLLRVAATAAGRAGRG